MRLARRQVIAGGAMAALAGCVPLDTTTEGRLAAALRIVEASVGGTLGVAFVESRRQLGHRDGLRFAMASTFKTGLAAFVLYRAQRGEIDLQEPVSWGKADLLPYAPFTRERLTSGASVGELAQAAQTLSDNTAANLLLARLGGPAALTAFLRQIGDSITRVDRNEPEVNFVPAASQSDTTTPAAMAKTLMALLDGSVLDPPHQATLARWMVDTTTGLKRVRAGVPQGWAVGDKTGNSGDWPGMGYSRGDIGFVRTPSGRLATFAAYHASPVGAPVAGEKVDAAFAEVGRILTRWLREVGA